jgi:hypothetical protein
MENTVVTRNKTAELNVAVQTLQAALQEAQAQAAAPSANGSGDGSSDGTDGTDDDQTDTTGRQADNRGVSEDDTDDIPVN